MRIFHKMCCCISCCSWPKQQYNLVLDYFEASRYLQERFKPVFYALLYFMKNENYRRRPPELEEPVDDMIKQVQQMAKEYR